MTPVHLHLLLNHIPVLGTTFAAALLSYAFIFNKEEVRKAALAAFVLVALMTPVVFFSGDNSVDTVKKLSNVTDAAIDAHDDAAEIAFAAMVGLGLLALAQLILYRYSISEKLKKRAAFITVIFAIIALVWTAHTANLGGKIRHAEELGAILK